MKAFIYQGLFIFTLLRSVMKVLPLYAEPRHRDHLDERGLPSLCTKPHYLLIAYRLGQSFRKFQNPRRFAPETNAMLINGRCYVTQETSGHVNCGFFKTTVNILTCHRLRERVYYFNFRSNSNYEKSLGLRQVRS